jgi:hypothetical protein
MQLHLKKRFLKSYRKLVAHPNPWWRRWIGIGLVFGGILGPVVPILGAWMFPFGVILLIVDLPKLRHHRRRYNAWWKRRLSTKKPKQPPTEPQPPASGT